MPCITCAGSSERYFNRIENRETFIGFLRREQEPGIPFYTIEFEPGGTIRQNRSYYDEEPGIEEIRGFLKLWQKEIKKRLTKEDKKHAAKSAILREQNIKELQKKPEYVCPEETGRRFYGGDISGKHDNRLSGI